MSLFQSATAVRAIIDDLLRTYSWPGGGGISSIKEVSSGSYVVELPQEERIDTVTYEVFVDAACHAKIIHRVEGTITQ